MEKVLERKHAEIAPPLGQEEERGTYLFLGLSPTNFYVDDGLVSLATPREAIDLLQRTRESLQTGGNLRLHKIASNSKEVMDAFEQQDRANNFKDIDLCVDELPTHQSLGLNWELETDTFTYKFLQKRNLSADEDYYPS
ncbi:Hypothetical predicted protein [Mytilus galloprovincialis]|uniref:Uncharacterized protein n=1 Tax=Mytilus galloprovincialis TaxID=29158 RepID=A0A8B6CGH4_MYTGA|nr:Hypothetical predicted protein [Mytilus galloprovincialis]